MSKNLNEPKRGKEEQNNNTNKDIKKKSNNSHKDQKGTESWEQVMNKAFERTKRIVANNI